MKHYIILAFLISITIACTLETQKQLDINYITPIAKMNSISDSIFFKNIYDIDYYNSKFYFTLFQENKIIETDDNFNMTKKLVSKGRGPNEFFFPTYTTCSPNYIVVNDDGNRRFNIYDNEFRYLTSRNYNGFVFSEFCITGDTNILYSCTSNPDIMVTPINNNLEIKNFKVQIPKQFLHQYQFKNPSLFHIKEVNGNIYFISRSFPYLERRSSMDYSQLARINLDQNLFFKEYLTNLSIAIDERPELKNNSIDLIKDITFSDTHLFLLCYKRNPKNFPKVDCNTLVTIRLTDLEVDRIFVLTDSNLSNVFNSICYFDNNIIAFNRNTGEINIFEINNI